MPQVLALEWDNSEARLVVANSRGDQIVIEQAFSVSLAPKQVPEGEESQKADVGKRIADAMSANGIGRIDTLVAVGRASIELRRLTLPPAPDDELPELARFQAMREFALFDEDWLLDFIPLEEQQEALEDEKPRNVLAAAIGPDLVKQIRKTCGDAGLEAERIILRPCAAASLLERAEPAADSPPRLLVDLLADEVDLTVVDGRKVVFLRTTRIGSDLFGNEDHRRALLGEIRRTIAAAENQLAGRKISSIVLFGSDEQHEKLAKSIETDLKMPAKQFEPFGGLSLGSRLRTALPEQAGRFAPLLGLAVAELEHTGHAIDFLNPRRRPAPPSRQPKYIIAGAIVAALILAFIGLRIMQHRRLNEDIQALNAQQKTLTAQAEKAKKDIELVKKINSRWMNSEIVWLDELHTLSDSFTPASEVMLEDIKITSAVDGGKIIITGLARNGDSVQELAASLRNEFDNVIDKGISADSTESRYGREFDLTIEVKRDDKDKK